MINKKTIENMKKQVKVRDEIKSEIKKTILTDTYNKMPLKRLILSFVTCAILISILVPMFNKKNLPIDLNNSILISVYAMENENYVLDENFETNTSKKQLIPSFKIKLAKYSKAMSSVPGIPIEFSLVNSNIDEIKISSEDVEILTIDEQTSRIDRKESTYSIKEDIIVYFNPKLDKKLCTINLDLIKNGKIMETKKILITEENYEYFASVE